MNNGDSIWGSLVATLEDQCDKVFNGNDAHRYSSDSGVSNSNKSNNLNLVNGINPFIDVPAEIQARWPDMGTNPNRGTTLNDFAPFLDQAQNNFETEVNVALQARMEEAQDELGTLHGSSAGASVAAAPSPIMRGPKIIPLKQWIKHALRCVGGKSASPAYLESAIRIAISLTDQLIQAEKMARYGITEKLEQLSIASADRWADFVMVRLKDGLVKNGGNDYWIPYETDGAVGIHGTANLNAVAEDQDMDKQLETFLESFERRHQQLKSNTCRDSPTQSVEMPAMSLASGPGSVDESSVFSDDCNYLSVGIAEIRRPENLAGSQGKTVSRGERDEIQRIYYLGLVLYELFSGGRCPPPELHALASSDGAFVSLPTLELVKDDEKEETKQGEAKRRQAPGCGMGLCQRSFQHLKLIGLPGPLCYLIFNMLDTIYGCMGGDECYTKLADVNFDLQLMQSKPEKFLRDLDMDKLSLSGLQLNDNAIPRDTEFECIKGCYRRRVLGSCEFAVIKGESGSGKSWLAQRFARHIVAEGGVFIAGKFDQMKQMIPFSALASAFDQYCDVLIREKDSPWVKGLVDHLNSTLGQDACHLIMLIPKLGQVLGNTILFSGFNLDQNCAHTKQRLNYLLTQLVEAISTKSPVAVIFLIDDVQWADVASISVLDLLLRRDHKKFFFLLSCRDDEMEIDHPICQLINDVAAIGIHATIVTLKCLEENELNTIMSDMLCLSPRIVRPLGNVVYKKTKGNPLFFSQILRSLGRNGLIRLDFDSQRWVWDEEKIYSMPLPDNVALCFANGINKLPFDVQQALRTLSMFGTSAKIAYIEGLEKELDLSISGPLAAAAAEGLVSHIEKSVQFNHDRIQEAVYGMIDEQVRLRNHLIYGDCLVKLSQNNGDVEMMFLGVHQINLGGPSTVNDTEELVKMAKYNLLAGKRAMEMSGFASAHRFFVCGTKFLPSKWSENYHISLELFELACKAALVSGNDTSFGALSDEVLNNARCFEDKLNINYIIMTSLVYTPRIMEALEMGRAILSRLGEEIPSNPSSENLDEHIRKTQGLIKGMSEDDLLNYRMMTDHIQLMKMKYLAKTESIAVLIRPDLHPFITLKMVQLTISHGLSPTAPIVFICFASLLAKAGNIQVGYKFALLSRRLLDKLNAHEIKGEVITAVTEVQCFVEPILATNELRAQGEHAAILAGDVYFGCISRLHYCLVLFWAGLNLNTVKESMSKAVQYMKDQGENTSLLITIIAHRTVLSLMEGESETPSESELLRIIQGNGSRPRQLIIFSFNNLYLAFLLNGNVGTVRNYAQEFMRHRKTTSYILFSDTLHAFILGLSAFQICREGQMNQSAHWLNIGKKCTSDMKLWAEQGSPWNFQHKYLLLKAEEFYSSGNPTAAKEAYNNAIVLARNHKVINDEALACELAGKFYFNTGNLQISLEYFRIAHEKYDQWGSTKKADMLFQFITEKFSGVLSRNVSIAASQELQNVSRKRRDL